VVVSGHPYGVMCLPQAREHMFVPVLTGFYYWDVSSAILLIGELKCCTYCFLMVALLYLKTQKSLLLYILLLLLTFIYFLPPSPNIYRILVYFYTKERQTFENGGSITFHHYWSLYMNIE
jgi:hypothetical protein